MNIVVRFGVRRLPSLFNYANINFLTQFLYIISKYGKFPLCKNTFVTIKQKLHHYRKVCIRLVCIKVNLYLKLGDFLCDWKTWAIKFNSENFYKVEIKEIQAFRNNIKFNIEFHWNLLRRFYGTAFYLTDKYGRSFGTSWNGRLYFQSVFSMCVFLNFLLIFESECFLFPKHEKEQISQADSTQLSWITNNRLLIMKWEPILWVFSNIVFCVH